MRECDVAWAADLFEGEGTWGYQPNNVRAELSMTDHDTVQRFHAIVEVGRLVLKKKYAEHHKQQITWRVTDRAGVERVLEMFRPWLSDRRRERGEQILRLQAETTAALNAEREAFCKNGHPRTPENTLHLLRGDGRPYQRCITCARERTREYRERR